MPGSGRHTYRKSLWLSLSNQGTAYGFTLTIWGSGALAVATYNHIAAVDAIAFVGGALFSYILALGVLNANLDPSQRKKEGSASSVFDFVDLPAVPAAIGIAYAICSSLPSQRLLGFALTGFAAAATYNLVAAAGLLIINRDQ